MRLVPDGESWRIEGPGSDRARVAYARLATGGWSTNLPSAWSPGSSDPGHSTRACLPSTSSIL